MESLLVHTLIFGNVLLIYVSIVFLIAQIKHDNSIMDVAYGPAFLTSAVVSLVLTKTTAILPILITGLMGIWAIRLAIRIYRKNHGKPEDARYAAWRTAWSARSVIYFISRSYFQINLLQGFIILLVSIPFILSLSAPTQFSLWFTLLGALIFTIGLTFESVADYQLDSFLQRKRAGTEPAVLMTTGLFRFCRRPNYFGETLIWWGFAIMVLPLPFGYLGIISPLVITYIVTKVTGPMLENIFLEKYPTEYRAYMARTNYFIPGRPKQ